jgi:hypothetical protein
MRKTRSETSGDGNKRSGAQWNEDLEENEMTRQEGDGAGWMEEKKNKKKEKRNELRADEDI